MIATVLLAEVTVIALLTVALWHGSRTGARDAERLLTTGLATGYRGRRRG